MELKNSRRLKLLSESFPGNGSSACELSWGNFQFVIETIIKLSWEEQAESLGLVSTNGCCLNWRSETSTSKTRDPLWKTDGFHGLCAASDWYVLFSETVSKRSLGYQLVISVLRWMFSTLDKYLSYSRKLSGFVWGPGPVPVPSATSASSSGMLSANTCPSQQT